MKPAAVASATGPITMFVRSLYLALGWLSVGLGIIGIIMPLFPTTPFLLVALWAFSRSSPELAEKLRNHRRVGPFIRDWQDAGVIPVKAKIIALLMMLGMLAYVVLRGGLPWWADGGVAVVLGGVAAFIVSRPGQRPAA